MKLATFTQSKIVKATSALLIAATLSTNAMADTRKTASVEEATGFGSGAVIGFLVGGPVGAILGAAGGAVLGNELDKKDIAEEALEAQKERTVALQQELSILNHQLVATQNVKEQLSMQKVSLENGIEKLSNQISTDFMFKSGSADIDSTYTNKLDALASFLAKHDNFKVIINGYADARGDKHNNLKLSLSRVQSVQDYLVQQGVKPSQVVSTAYGEQKAKQTVKSVDEYAFDRRVTAQLVMTAPVDMSVASN